VPKGVKPTIEEDCMPPKEPLPPHPLNDHIFINPNLGYVESIHLYDSDQDGKSYILLDENLDIW
jgi:hypothetical protein